MSMGGGGGSSGTGGGTQVQNSGPWKPQQPYLLDLFARGQTAQNATPNQPFQGNMIAGPSSQQLNALQMAEGLVPGLAGLGQGSIDLGQRTVNGDFLDPSTNPAFAGMVSAALNPVVDKYTRNILPGIKSNSVANGAYGGSREAIAQGLAAQGFAREAADATSRLAFGVNQSERQLQQNAPAMIAAGLGLQTAPSDILSNIGGQYRGFSQDAINNSLALRDDSRTSPWAGLAEYAALLQGNMGASGSTTTSSNTSPFASGISGALGGAALGAGIGQLVGAQGLSGYAPYLGIGAALGGLGGAFF